VTRAELLAYLADKVAKWWLPDDVVFVSDSGRSRASSRGARITSSAGCVARRVVPCVILPRPRYWAGYNEGARRHFPDKEDKVILATTTVEDFDRFLKIFSTKGAEKRKQHGSKGATVFRDPNEADRVWVIFDWDEKGWQSFVSDPEVPAIMKEAGHKGKPQAAKLSGQYGA
jgi:hypothetical protein